MATAAAVAAAAAASGILRGAATGLRCASRILRRPPAADGALSSAACTLGHVCQRPRALWSGACRFVRRTLAWIESGGMVACVYVVQKRHGSRVPVVVYVFSVNCALWPHGLRAPRTGSVPGPAPAPLKFSKTDHATAATHTRSRPRRMRRRSARPGKWPGVPGGRQERAHRSRPAPQARSPPDASRCTTSQPSATSCRRAKARPGEERRTGASRVTIFVR